MKLIICGDPSVTNGTRPVFEKQDKETAFTDVAKVFADADRVIINLECVLTDSENCIKKCGPNLKGPKTIADTLKAVGITDCLLSNNHIFDFGKEGVHDTLEQLDRVGLNYTGYGDNYENSGKNMYIEQNGIKIGIVNVCEHEYSYAVENRKGARPFDAFETMQDIREAKKSADYVIVVYHGGTEHCRYPSPALMKACREMVRCGADVVLCQHSHCIGCFETFEGAHILYGQGNFHFPEYMVSEMWNEGLIACLDGRKEFCRSMAGTYKNAMAGKTGDRDHYTPDDNPDEYQLFAHYLDCEAHTDVWRELFKTYNYTNEI